MAFADPLKNSSHDPSSFSMTGTHTGGIYNPTDVSVLERLTFQIWDVICASSVPRTAYHPLSGIEGSGTGTGPTQVFSWCHVSRELQVHGPMVFIWRYNNIQVTGFSFVEGCWYHMGPDSDVEIAPHVC
ncbi:hypothetical protein HD554DRAFT_2038777 [Boletus coccyginus]|nr:hypothetical protein HD554DRAFT_2038777 [Boletus coccyginus]